ncbi:MAG: carboxypeptidase regulatory-like domain-containing protein [Trueperaceae bacterium]|nr:carboxypeptidase regulatory-like domain-containing protein [Trueperaceae bacterium]
MLTSKLALGPVASRSLFAAPLRAALLIVVLVLAGAAAAGAGRLGPGDEVLNSGEYFDRVSFEGSAGDQIVIELTSSEFDPYLMIIDSSNNVVTQVDDSEGMGVGVRLTFTLPNTGQFTAIVTTAYVGERGGYRLVISSPGQAGTASPALPQTQAQTPTVPATGSRPRTVTGAVVDTLGRPIAGARVWIQPAITTGLVEVRTDNNGRYVAEGLIDVPYNAKAWAFVEYGGRRICMRLGMESPTDFDSFVPTQGAVRNFVMRLTGPIEDLRSLDEHFGGRLRAIYAPAYSSTGGTLEITFMPQGPLIDGTTIAPFTRTVDPRRGIDVNGVPPGPYEVSVQLVGSDGSRRPVRVSASSMEELRNSIHIDWTGDGSCGNTSGLDWAYVYLEIPQ